VSAFVFLSGCSFFNSDTNKYFVTVKYDGGETKKSLKNISIVIGSDKFWWSSVESGEKKSVTLYAEKNPVINASLFYSLDDRERTWEIGNFPENADYKIDLTINAEGSIEQNICKTPC
jgi:hypothetical protein